ncbi:MAG: ATP-grasp domain-containing protein [Phycisphaerales bacterium]|nr:ATP-grasp domain-containing protein [Phycisphaerae bacterium]NNF43905.1 ATP-grasp domain-containing protein [Phycisphaerales bacterium]NNM24680.1 ATP-grasp domain-containing protein [Phycisphaerales bacterium]
MNLLLISPGFPSEMPLFTRGLAQAGARVIGLGDQPPAALPERTRAHLADYIRVGSLWDEMQVVQQIQAVQSQQRIDRVECLWEPGMILAARLRETLGLPGLTVAQTIPFRDKGRMKEVLDAAGLRTPRHHRAVTADGVREAAAAIGFPVAVKPISGAGSADTHRVESADELERILPTLRHVPEVSVEEWIEGQEYTFDTICIDGRIVFPNVCWYRPNPIIARQVEWISPQTIGLRRLDVEPLREGLALGRAVLDALGFRTGFTHMEWFRTASGEAIFGEIGARPPGARTVDIMNYLCDADLYAGWGEAVTRGTFSQPTERRYNAASIFKRAQGQGRIQRIDGLESILARYGPHVMSVDLLPIGAPRRNWLQTLMSDGHLFVRHQNLDALTEILDHIGTDLQIYAGH